MKLLTYAPIFQFIKISINDLLYVKKGETSVVDLVQLRMVPRLEEEDFVYAVKDLLLLKEFSIEN